MHRLLLYFLAEFILFSYILIMHRKINETYSARIIFYLIIQFILHIYFSHIFINLTSIDFG